MVFGIFDLQKKSEINYSVFLQELFQPLPPVRERIVIDAFKHIDQNGDGKLSLEEIKQRFDPSNHPDVVKGVKNA